MTHMMNRATPPALQIDRIGPLLLVVALLCGLMAFFWLKGATDRVIYLGPDHGRAQSVSEVHVKTEPYGLYILARDDAYRSMKIDCRYDFTYAPTFGRTKGAAPGLRIKHVRSASLVDCP